MSGRLEVPSAAATHDDARAEHEHKYVLGREAAGEFLARTARWLRADVRDVLRPVAYTRTTYLDTDDAEFLRSSGGPTARRLRIREYAAARNLAVPARLGPRCFLELKQSGGTVRTKVRVCGPPAAIARGLADRSLEAVAFLLEREASSPSAASAVETLGRILRERALEPRVATWYRRACYRDEAASVRVTVDAAIAYLRPGPLGAPGQPVVLTGVVERGPECVLEVKLRGAPPPWLAAALDRMAEARGFSKFHSAMLAIERTRRRDLGRPGDPLSTPVLPEER